MTIGSIFVKSARHAPAPASRGPAVVHTGAAFDLHGMWSIKPPSGAVLEVTPHAA
jgi:hypothetical protein